LVWAKTLKELLPASCASNAGLDHDLGQSGREFYFSLAVRNANTVCIAILAMAAVLIAVSVSLLSFRGENARQHRAVMYIEMLDGLRSYYEKRLKNNESAGFQAAMSMSFLFGLCAIAIFILCDLQYNGRWFATMWLYEHKLAVLAFGILTAWAHVQYAKYHNVYSKVGSPISSAWRPWLVGYSLVACLLTVVALWATYLARPHG
jgi:hypothetical protein